MRKLLMLLIVFLLFPVVANAQDIPGATWEMDPPGDTPTEAVAAFHCKHWLEGTHPDRFIFHGWCMNDLMAILPSHQQFDADVQAFVLWLAGQTNYWVCGWTGAIGDLAALVVKFTPYTAWAIAAQQGVCAVVWMLAEING